MKLQNLVERMITVRGVLGYEPYYFSKGCSRHYKIGRFFRLHCHDEKDDLLECAHSAIYEVFVFIKIQMFESENTSED